MEGQLKIHSQNILPIIKQWLYTDKEIFVRELVSNSCDALRKLECLQEVETPRIDIVTDKESKTVTISDNGIGMSQDEVETYIAQIAFSGAEEFVQKYESKEETKQIIGHFGLGFYSAYMVASSVEIQTLSYKENASPVKWVCDGSSSYTIEEGSRQERGTSVILTISESEEEYLEPARLRHILQTYCRFLPYPVYLNGSCINETPPLWSKKPSELEDKDYLEFYETLFPGEEPPLFWVHLNVDFPFHLKGILYFPKLSQEKDLKRESILLFCNRVFVSDDCSDILPEYLTILRGAIDSPDIPLNVSRSYLQTDATVRQLGNHLSKKVSDRLAAFYREDRDRFLASWEDIELIIKFGALHDEKFYERIKPLLVWKTAEGEWTTLEELLTKTDNKTIYYAENESPCLDLYKEKGLDVLITRAHVIDQAIINLLERKANVTFKRIDSDLAEELLDPSKEKTLLDADGKPRRAQLADFVRSSLSEENLEVEAKSLASQELPALLMMKEEERRMRDSLLSRGGEMAKHSHALVKPTLIVNTNSKLMQQIELLGKENPALAKELLVQVLDLTRLSQKEIDPGDLPAFVKRTTGLLEKLLP